MGDKLTDTAVYGSPVREALRKGGRINLRSLDVEPVHIPSDATVLMLRPKVDSEIPEAISQHFREELKRLGFNRTYTGLVEMVRNAFQHGNNRTPRSKVRVSYNINAYSFQAFVEDEGIKPAHPELFSFVDRTKHFVQGVDSQTFEQRKRILQDAERFYGHTRETIPEGHGGLGTIIAHTCFDKVDYFTSADLGGLAVRLKAKNP